MTASGKIAVVTGAAGGIGSAIVEKFLQMGLRIFATDRDLEKLKKREGLFLREMDVEKMESVQRVAREVETLGGADILVNNAGILTQSPLTELSEESFLKTLNVNLLGTFRASQAFGRSMIRKKSGKIIQIASISATRGFPEGAHYAASKAGVLALARTMAIEWAPHNIQVNTILPGFIETDMMGPFREPLKKIAAWRIPARRLGTPQEVAQVVGLLVSADSSYLTGSEIVIDGGFTL